MCRVLILVGGVVMGATSAQAQVWDAAGDFSARANPNGAWTYGFTLTDLGAVEPLPDFVVFEDVLSMWRRNLKFPESFPAVVHNGTDEVVEWAGPGSLVQPGQLLLHPGVENEVCVLRWTAPETGTYDIRAAFVGNSIECGGGSSTVGIEIVVAGESVFTDAIGGFGDESSFVTTLEVAAGETVDIVADDGGIGPGGCTICCDHLGTEVLIAECAADVNGDGVLNVLDFVAFQSAWQEQALIADCNADGDWDVLDFVCYQQLFVAGCP